MSHLNPHHRNLFRNTLYPLVFLITMIAAVIAVARTAKTNILLNHSPFDLSREQFAQLATINLEVALWLLLAVGFIAGTIMALVLYHQHITARRRA